MRTRRHSIGRTLMLGVVVGFGSWTSAAAQEPPVEPPSDAPAAPPAAPPDAPAAPPAAPPRAPSEEIAAEGRMRLARLLVRSSLELVRAEEPRTDDYRVALAMTEWATELAPEWTDAWRVLVQLASLGEGLDESGADRLQRALTAIVRQDPTDEVARLRLLSLAIDRFPTAEQRVAAYERLLDPANRGRLGGPVAARLAFELALLLHRSGDVEGYARWLAESVALDPTFAAATEAAAGFLRHRAVDPVGEAELFVAAMLANPVNPLPRELLASICLREAAFAAASRLHDLTIATTPLDDPASAGFVAAKALALWAQGTPDRAIALIDARQKELDQIARMQVRAQDPEIDLAGLEQVRARPDRQVATLRAIILRSTGSPEADAAVGTAMLAMQLDFEDAEQLDPDPELTRRLAELGIDSIGFLLWMSPDPEGPTRMLAEVATQVELSERARRRLDGWIALRRGEVDAAIALLEPATDDPLAMLGLADAYLAAGRRSDAARTYLAVHRAGPGTALGVWARDRLAEIIARPVPASDVATRLDALVGTVPSTYDRLVLGEGRSVGVTLRSTKPSYAPLEPVQLVAEIVNATDLPLAIGSEGPIEPNLAVLAQATIAQLDRPVAAPPMVVPLQRRFRLGPRERLAIPIDLSLGSFGEVLDRTALAGSNISVRAISNFRPVEGGALQPGVLGAKGEASQVRVEGVRVTSGWIEDAVAAVRVADRAEDLPLMSLLAAVGVATEGAPQLPEGEFDAIGQIWEAMQEGWTHLDPAGQAWLLTSLPATPSPGMTALVDNARSSNDRVVMLGYILGRSRGSDDPVLRRAIASDDARLSLIARLVADRLERRQAQPADLPTP